MQSAEEQLVQPWEEIDEQTRKSWEKYMGQITPPPLLFELSAAHLSLEEFNPRELAEKVGRDPVLGGKLLAVANSAKYGLVNPLTSIQRAIVHLGFNLVKSVAVSYMMENSFTARNPATEEHVNYCRRWSAAASILAYQWAQAVELADPATASTLALLARVGTLLLGLSVSPPAEQYRELTDELARLQMERERWQVTTPVLSAEQIKRWGIPEPIPELVQRLWEPLVQPLAAAAPERMLVLVTASVAIAAQHLNNEHIQPGPLIDSEPCAALKDNLVTHRLLDRIHDVWSSTRLQRDLAGAAML